MILSSYIVSLQNTNPLSCNIITGVVKFFICALLILLDFVDLRMS